MSIAAQKETAPGRISRSGSADRKTSGLCTGKEYTNHESDASVYDGRTPIGFLVDEPKQCAALTPDRFMIGLFPDRKAASHAIIAHQQTATAA